MKDNISQSDYYKVIAVVMLSPITALGAQYCIQPVIKLISVSFGRGPEGAGLIMSACLLGMALALLALVGISERLPVKKCVIGALGFGCLTTAGAMLVKSFTLFLVLRALQGAILAVIPVLAVAYARRILPKEKVGFAVSMYVCGGSIGGLSGRLMMGVLADWVGWEKAMLYLGSLYFLFTLLILYLMKPDKELAPLESQQMGQQPDFFSRENLPLLWVCLFGFSFGGCFLSVFNFIPYVFSAPPYSFSTSVIGMLFTLQVVGTFSSFAAGKLHSCFGPGKIMLANLLLILAGIWISVLVPVLAKILGLVLIIGGFFAVHAMASGVCGQVARVNKAGATAAYMFFYYSGASIMTAACGYLYAAWGWWGIVGLITALVAVSCAILSCLWKYMEE